jgi:hypothetical protein
MDVAFFEPPEQCDLNVGPREGGTADAAQPARRDHLHPVKTFVCILEPGAVEAVKIIFSTVPIHVVQLLVNLLFESRQE